MPTIAIILGTRPEIIKLYTVIEALKKYFKVIIIHTGQHYSPDMNQNNLDVFGLKIDQQLHSKSDDSYLQLAQMQMAIYQKLILIKPTGVVIHGDTNSTLAGALTAKKLNLPLYHIESGARCFDQSVPEELNRIVADHFSTLNFCYDKESKNNLKKEGIVKNVFKFSNTAYSTCHYINQKHLRHFKEKSNAILVTIHRAENTNNIKNLKSIVGALNWLSQKNQIIFPIHPRTKKTLLDSNLLLSDRINLIAPLDYLHFLKHIKSSKLIISDSGGVIDESIYFNTPLIILRKKTERSDLVKVKKIKQLNPEEGEKKLIKKMEIILNHDLKKMKKIKIKFDVKSSQKIAQTIFSATH